MKNSRKSIYSVLKCSLLLLPVALLLGGCQTKDTNTNSQNSICETVTNIEGTYTCTGECIVIGKDGIKTVIKVSGETDKVHRFSGANTGLYQIDISGSNDFHEIEIGALTGRTLRTATAEVSDTLYPVLEEYVFDTDESCNAVGYTKIVRNPDPELFKACYILCRKSTN
jgi:hypothetical protein